MGPKIPGLAKVPAKWRSLRGSNIPLGDQDQGSYGEVKAFRGICTGVEVPEHRVGISRCKRTGRG